MSKEFLSSKISKSEKINTANHDRSLNPNNVQWWKETDDNLFRSVFATVNTIETELQTFRFQCRMYRHLYSNPEAWFTPSAPQARQAGANSNNVGRKAQYNVVQSCVDTAASMIAKNQPKPQFLTLGEDNYYEQQKAKLLTNYVAGVFDTCTDNGDDIYGVMRKVFLDAAITGTGAIKFYTDEGKIKVEWVFPDELVIDNIEGMRENPTQIHRRKFLPRDIVKYQFPEFEEQILTCGIIQNMAVTNTVSDLIEVIESWHMKSGKDATDGKHSITIENCTLFSEVYDKPFYPIIFFRWAQRPLGFWGRGIGEELAGLQMRINDILRVIQISQELIAVPIIFIEDGSMVQDDHVATNKIARLIHYTGSQPPIILSPQAVSPELYTHVEWLIQSAYQISGISQANAGGNKPPEVKSGAAIREVADIASGRFELVGQQWERLFITGAKIIVSLSADLYKEDKKLSVKVKDKKFLSEIPWKDVALDEDDFGIRVFPISGLPSTPAGKMDQLMDYVQAGWIDKDFAMQLINFPDLDEYVNLETAPLELTRKILSKMINDGEYTPPNQYMNLNLCLQLATLEVVRAQLDGVDEDKLQLIRDFIDEVNDLITKTTPPPPPPPPAPQPPQAPGVPPQASQQVPGVPQSPQQ